MKFTQLRYNESVMRRVVTSFLIFVFTFFVFSVGTVSAKAIANDKGNVTIAKTEVVNDDLFIGAQIVEIAGTVNGDVFIGAQTVKISGIINGNLHIGANSVDLGGTVKGNVYVGAQNVLVSSASIGGSLLIGAATVNIDKDSVIGGSVLAGVGTLSIDSQVKRSVYAGTESLTIGSDTKIGKDLYYAAGNGQGQANIAAGAKIAGSVYKSEAKTATASAGLEATKKNIPAIFNAAKFGGSIIFLIGSLIVGFLYFKLFGRHFTETSGIVSGSFWKSLGVGFLVTIAFVPGLIVLLITVVGIPLAGLAFLMLLLYFYLAKIVVSLPLGNWIFRKFNWKSSTYGASAFGLLTIFILRAIPIVGFLIGLVVLWTGLGALTLKTFQRSD